MTELDIDGIKFKFPLSWNASKHDEWLYYRKHYSKTADGVKAVDIIAVHRKTLLDQQQSSARPGSATARPLEWYT